jgi:carboxyl-terminal processing protease
MLKTKKALLFILVLALCFSTLIMPTYAADTQAAATTDNTSAQYLQSVMNLIKQKYNGNVTDEQLVNAAMKGMLTSLDDYSTFMTQSEYDSFYGSFQGSVVGIGILAQQTDDGYISIVKVYSGSPAQKAGVLSGDKIVEVNGKSVAGQDLEAVTSQIKGAQGTKVKVGFQRQGYKTIITYEMTRSAVTIPSVNYQIRGDIGYIAIDSFGYTTCYEVNEALSSFDQQKITKIVIDLRNNPGGLVESAIEVARLFVPKGLITRLEYKDPSLNDWSYYSYLEQTKYKLAALVNENTASAAEILTGAIKDSKAGTIIGTKTFGKAKVQNFTPVLSTDAYNKYNEGKTVKTVNAQETDASDTDELAGYAKMTIGMYYTPNGNCIDLKGITPDIIVPASTTDSVDVKTIPELSKTVKPKLGSEYYDVLSAEWILKLLNYSVDTPDLKFDAKTEAAVKKFQKENKLYSYGALDFTTQKLLNEKLIGLKAKLDKPYSKAIEVLEK